MPKATFEDQYGCLLLRYPLATPREEARYWFYVTEEDRLILSQAVAVNESGGRTDWPIIDLPDNVRAVLLERGFERVYNSNAEKIV